MSRRLPPALTPLPILLALAVFTPAQAQVVNRCVDGSGNAVFTDRPCGDLGARERRAPSPAADDTGQQRPLLGCAESPAELVDRLRMAVEARDVNRMSALYHWSGATRRSSDSVLASLQQTLARPITEVRLAEPPPVSRSLAASAGPAAAPAPTAVELDHTPGLASPFSGGRTRFELVRNVGCWWIRF